MPGGHIQSPAPSSFSKHFSKAWLFTHMRTRTHAHTQSHKHLGGTFLIIRMSTIHLPQGMAYFVSNIPWLPGGRKKKLLNNHHLGRQEVKKRSKFAPFHPNLHHHNLSPCLSEHWHLRSRVEIKSRAQLTTHVQAGRATLSLALSHLVDECTCPSALPILQGCNGDK